MPYDPGVEKRMRKAEGILKRYRKTLRILSATPPGESQKGR
jgi:hypothetical protein